MKHTPGPWNFDWHGINHNGERICKVCHSDPYIFPEGKPVRNDRFDADSFLIASAPELLEACKTALVVISQHYPEENMCCSNRINKINQAIEKAEGRGK